MKKKTASASPLEKKVREKYILTFFLAFIAFAIVILPLAIYTGGYFIYYGDFNSQQLAFYQHANDMIRNGNFLWDWQTDLGANFIGSYSFYLLFSPFFLVTLLLKQNWVMYAMPVLLCLKYSVAAVTAYTYIRKFVKNTDCAMIGGLLYAFSGFQSYNIFFNHFHDVTAFFPLLLCALEDRINRNKRGVFAIAVAFMAILNYFFFTGQVTFLLIYLILRCSCDDFKINSKKYAGVVAEAVIGVMIACAVLVPSALAIIDNERISTGLYGLDMITYSDRTRILRILQSFFMIPDAPSRPNLLDTDSGKWASIAGYLPLFSMAGVIAFMGKNKGHWASKMIITCAVCAFIPILNSMFYLFNGSYYARWYYMPILIMAMMTANTLEDEESDMKTGLKVCAFFLTGFGLASLIPIYEDGKAKWFSFPNNLIYFYITLGVSVICLIAAYYIHKLKTNKKPFIKQTVVATVTSCFMCTAVIVYYGVSIGPYPKEFINNTFNAEEFDLSVPQTPSAETEIIPEDETIPVLNENSFYRVDIDEDYANYPMFWGYSNMKCFHSIVPASIMNFYSNLDVERDVSSKPSSELYTLRGLLSVKYYFSYNDGTPKSTVCDVKGFEYIKSQNNFDIYENKNFVPMGFTYNYYLTESDVKDISTSIKEQLLIKAVILDDEYAAENAEALGLEKLDNININEEQYAEECANRSASSCYSFEYDSSGFTAKNNLESESLVFFSVPFDKGWTATVNGVSADIIKTNYGFMAVKGETGENIIKFTYFPYGLKLGAIISAAGLVFLMIYLIATASVDEDAVTVPKKSSKKKAKAPEKETAKSKKKPSKSEISDAKKRAKNEKKKQKKEKSETASLKEPATQELIKDDDKKEVTTEEFEIEEPDYKPSEKTDKIKNENKEESEKILPGYTSEESKKEIERFMKGYTSVINIKKTADDFKNSKLFEDIENDADSDKNQDIY